jgi:hypothetical protein
MVSTNLPYGKSIVTNNGKSLKNHSKINGNLNIFPVISTTQTETELNTLPLAPSTADILYTLLEYELFISVLLKPETF